MSAILETTETIPASLEINVEVESDCQLSQELQQFTHQWWDKFNSQFRTNYPYPNIFFSLKTKSAGRATFKSNTINYNLAFYKNNKDTFVKRTIPHEIAHLFEFYFLLEKGIILFMNDTYVALSTYKGKILNHRGMWKTIMKRMGINQRACHSYSLTAVHPYVYKCACKEHPISKIIHSKILRGKSYRCRYCKTTLTFAYEKEA